MNVIIIYRCILIIFKNIESKADAIDLSISLFFNQIVISLVNGRPGANYFSPSSILREFTKATNIRLHFLRTNTLLGHLISKAQRDPTVTRRVSSCSF